MSKRTVSTLHSAGFFAAIVVSAASAVVSLGCGEPPELPEVATAIPAPVAAPFAFELGTPAVPEPVAGSLDRPSAPTPAAAQPYDANQNMLNLWDRRRMFNFQRMLDALQAASRNKDPSQVPVIIELMRFVGDRSFVQPAAFTLNEITGQNFGFSFEDTKRWTEWLGMHREQYPPPSNFMEWKADLFNIVDDQFKNFIKMSGIGLRIDLTELLWGGVRFNDIVDLKNPTVTSASDAAYLLPEERVFGVSINGEHRAYPLRILNAHEIANDVLGEESITLAYDVQTGAAILYSPEIEGEDATFGNSGLIYRSNMLMVDRVTGTLWNHFAGEPVLGILADSGIKLPRLPLVLTTWGEWRARHPKTTVLSNETGIFEPQEYLPESDPQAVYQEYLSSPDTVFPVWNRSDALQTKDIVLGVAIGDNSKAYPVSILQQSRVVNDLIGETEIVIVASGSSQAARVYERDGRVFAPGQQDARMGELAVTVADSRGTTWRVTEEFLVDSTDDSQRLNRIPTHMAFWFGWFAFNPDTEVYKP